MPEDLQFPTREECVVPDLLAARAAADPDKPFVLFEDEHWTYGPTPSARRGAPATAFSSSASRWATTSPSWHADRARTCSATWFGANAAGAVYAPLNLAARGSYLEHTLNLAESKVLVAHHQLVDRLAGPRSPAASRQVVVVGGRAAGWACRGRRSRWRSSSTASPTTRPALPRPVEPWDDLSLIYTSGTTGPSKGVRAAHAAFWNYANCFILPYVDEDDRYLSSLPMFHTAGTGITYSMLRAGGSMALNKGFSASRFWDDVRRFEATITIVIHGMVTFMLDQPEKPDDADNPLRTVYMGPLSRHKEFAAPLRRQDLHRVRHDRGAGADRLGSRPGRRRELRRARPTRCTTSCGSSTRTTSRCRRTRPASSSRGTRCRGRSTPATRTCPRRPPRHGATAGSTPATSSRRTRTATSTSSTGSRT